MDIPLMLLYVSTVMTLVLLILIIRTKNKKALQNFFLIAFWDIFLWSGLDLLRQNFPPDSKLTEVFYYNGINTLMFFLSLLLLYIGYGFSKSGSKINKNIYLLLVIPVTFTLLTWINPNQLLFYYEFSDFGATFKYGILAPLVIFVNYGMIVTGIFFLMRFSIKNAGFFSKQSMLIILGTSIPLFTDAAIYTQLLHLPKYFDVIAFAFAAPCFFVAIFRFKLFKVMPVALQTIVDHISDGYVVLNDMTELTDYNKTFLKGFEGIAAVERKVPFLQLFNGNLSEKTRGSLSKIDGYIKDHKICRFEIHIEEESVDKYFIVEITPVESNGTFACTIVLFKDITEQKKDADVIARTQVALLESEHLASLGQLVGGIAHNLKTPIMSVAGGLEGLSDLVKEYDESLEDDEVTIEDHREIAQEMREWLLKLKEYTAYMSDIITTVKGQAVQLTATTTDNFTIQELVKRVDILMNHELKKFCCKLVVNSSVDMQLQVKGEVNSFVQVINNLIINAVDAYEGQEGVIDFNISRSDKEPAYVLFEVRDSASGMTDEVQKKLFKEMITTKAKNGTGLGLYMSYSTIAGRFGGKMWFHSVHGVGTSFYIMIPAV